MDGIDYQGKGIEMKTVFQLFVNGMPKAQPRPRMAANGHVYNPDAADAWKEEIKAAFLPFLRSPITEPVSLRVSFFLPRPKAMKGKEEICIPHVKKPDLDNLLKACMDAMTNAGVWQDDALVFATNASKWYARRNKTGAQIIVEIFKE
jgi:Holliday junction resolvase RusA-like endonuclease